MLKKEFKSVEEMSAFLTHEINTPLTYMKGNLEIMQDDIEMLSSGILKNELIQSEKKIMDGIKRIEKTINIIHSVTKKS